MRCNGNLDNIVTREMYQYMLQNVSHIDYFDYRYRIIHNDETYDLGLIGENIVFIPFWI